MKFKPGMVKPNGSGYWNFTILVEAEGVYSDATPYASAVQCKAAMRKFLERMKNDSITVDLPSD